MGRWLDLADAARSTGLQVVEVAGWRTRGKPTVSGPGGIDCHHTATSDKAKGDIPTLSMLIGGRSDLPGPLCNIGLSRSGVVYVVASGKANHAGRTDTLDSSNTRAIGIEAENDGVGPWTGEQYAAYVQLCAGLAKWYKLPVSKVRGHKEIAIPYGRKNDPNFDMGAFRAAVAAYHAAPATPQLSQAQAGAILATIGKDAKAFQSASGLEADGVIGPLTMAKLVAADLHLGVVADTDYVRYLRAGQEMLPGQGLNAAGGNTRLSMQTDGNLVLYRDGKAVWQVGTRGDKLAMQQDGNMVLYCRGVAMWATGTNGKPGTALIVQDDGNMVLYGPDGKPLWNTKTQR